jgi:hypothetical protein
MVQRLILRYYEWTGKEFDINNVLAPRAGVSYSDRMERCAGAGSDSEAGCQRLREAI